MRIKTASTRRAIGRWKNRARAEATNFRSWALTLEARAIAPQKLGGILFALSLALALSLNFAALEFAMLVVNGEGRRKVGRLHNPDGNGISRIREAD